MTVPPRHGEVSATRPHRSVGREGPEPLLRAALVLFAALVMSGCEARVPLILDVHTDLIAYEEFDVVRITVGDEVRDLPVRSGDRFLPVARRFDGFSVAANSVASIEVALLARTRAVLRRRFDTTVRERRVLPVWLLRSCLDVRCPNGADRAATECDDGRCVAPVCEGAGCGTTTGGCRTSSDCAPPAAACATSSCMDGRCTVLQIEGSCDSDEYCAPESGCRARMMAPPDAGAGDAGGLDAGPSDGGGSDVPFDLSDTPRTDTPLDVPLPPECSGDGDCPPPIDTGWQGCGWPSFCAESAPDELRMITRFPCLDGRCTRTDMTDMRPCARGTSGMECGTTEVGPWGPCVYGVVCPIMGTRERTITSYACSGGGCAPSSFVERDSSTEGCPPFPEVCDLFDNDCDGACDPGCRTPIWRSYRDSTASHLFTVDGSEAMCCGFAVESSAAFYLYGTDMGGGLIPLHRCFAPGSNVHVFGTSGCEGVPDAVYEQVVGYLSPSFAFCSGVPLHRLTLGERSFLTTSDAEVSFAMSIGWTYDRVLGRVWTTN